MKWLSWKNDIIFELLYFIYFDIFMQSVLDSPKIKQFIGMSVVCTVNVMWKKLEKN